MKRSCILMWLFVAAVASVNGYCQTTIAGRTVDQYAALLADADRVVRLGAAHSLGAFGVSAGPALVKSLDHGDPAVRYIAARHLGLIGGEPLSTALPRLTKLARDDGSLAVRLAASFALCRAGKTDEHLQLLQETLKYPERGMACSAAELIGEIGPSAIAAADALGEVIQNNGPVAGRGDYHLGGAAANALEKIRDDGSTR